jgi:RNAse (barnase) inhibitor barstar
MTFKLTELLGRDAGGVYRYHGKFPAEKMPVAITREIDLVVIDLARARDKNAFLTAAAKALLFPDYFGHNWDAFYDCLLELENRQEKGFLLWLRDASGFARAEPEEFATAIDALREAVEYWNDKQKILLVVAELEAPILAPELPELSS